MSIETSKDLKSLIRNITNSLKSLTFSNNFKSFEETVTIPASTELQISNKLTTKPDKYIIVRKSNAAIVADGPTQWSNDFIYLKNYDSTDSTTITVIFFK